MPVSEEKGWVKLKCLVCVVICNQLKTNVAKFSQSDSLREELEEDNNNILISILDCFTCTIKLLELMGI